MLQYLILKAMLVLREFTVSDLARFCRAKQNTVRTVINRHQAWIESTGAEETGKRGGQPRRYRVKDTALRSLEAEVNRAIPLQESVGPLVRTRGRSQAGLGLLLVEQELAGYWDVDTLQERETILSCATDYARGAKADATDASELDLAKRAHSVVLLLEAKRLLLSASPENRGSETVQGALKALAKAVAEASLGEPLVSVAKKWLEEERSATVQLVFPNQSEKDARKWEDIVAAIGKYMQVYITKVGEFDPLPTETLVLAVDSKKTNTAPLLEQVRTAYPMMIGRVVVLDLNSNMDLRNQVFQGRAQYLDHAQKLSSEAFAAALHRKTGTGDY